MIVGRGAYQRDVYKCVNCMNWIGPGDLFCKHCGYKFNTIDVQNMKSNSSILKSWHAPFHGKFDEIHKCKICECYVNYTYKFCKKCGYEFNDNDKESMKDVSDQNFKESLVYVVLFFAVNLFIFIYVFESFK